jgi:adenine-specific DNA methylase
MYEMSGKILTHDVIDALKKLFNNEELKSNWWPRINNIHYYPARIPTWGARVVTLASLVESGSSKLDLFLEALGYNRLKERVKLENRFIAPFIINTNKKAITELLGKNPEEVIVVDPMAGGGSIPLESLRLGFTTIAGDINPVSFLLLRATIEFPAKYGSHLFDLLLTEAKKLIDYAKQSLGKYYSSDEKHTINVLGIKHHCGGIIPIVSTTVLSKEDRIFFKFEVINGKLKAKLTKEPPPPIHKCLHCSAPISYEILKKEWAKKHSEVINKLVEGMDASDLVEELYIPVAIENLHGYREPTEDDKRFQIEAYKELLKLAKEDDSFLQILPTSEIPNDNGVFENVKKIGLTHWHMLFTPRQLLALYLLIRYVKQRAIELYSEYGELGIAISLYLALILTKTFNFNNLLTQWDASKEGVRDLVGSQYALNKSANVGYDFVDAAIQNFGIKWVLEAEIAESGKFYITAGGILPVVKLLCDNLEGLWKEGKDAIYLWDATKLSENIPEIKADLIHVDPPYYDQHDYAGIMEFFWQILQRALMPVLDVLFPKNAIKIDWSPYQSELPRQEIRGPPPKSIDEFYQKSQVLQLEGFMPPKKVDEFSKFGDAMEVFFKECLKVLKPDGIFVMWYTYGKIEGWEELFYRLYKAGMEVKKCWQVWSQSPQRRVALQGSAFFTSMVIVAKSGTERILIDGTDDPKFVNAVSESVNKSLTNILQRYGFEMFNEATVMAFADAISAATRFEIMGTKDESQRISNFRELKNEALKIAVNEYLKKLAEIFQIKYFPVESLDKDSKLYLLLMLVSDEEFRIPYDFSNKLSQILGGANFRLLAQNRGGNKWFLKPLAEVAKLFSPSVMTETFKLLNEVSKTIEKFGERTAEEVIQKFSKDSIAYANYMISFCELFGENKLVKIGLINPMLIPKLKRVLGGFA